MKISAPQKLRQPALAAIFRRAVVAAVAGTLAATTANAQQIGGGVFAYPTKGQSSQQQELDKFECHKWGVAETGYDPTVAPQFTANSAYDVPPPPPPPSYNNQQQQGSLFGIGNGGLFQGGGVIGDAATGAALGAAGGAIAGDAGKGAAIGAVASTLFGALSRSSQPQQQQPNYNYEQQRYQQAQAQQRQYQQQQALQQSQQAANYQRAFGACMNARGYTVQ